MAKSKCSYHVYNSEGTVVARVKKIGKAREVAQRTADRSRSKSRFTQSAWVERVCHTRTHKKRTDILECRGSRCTKMRRSSLRFRRAA